MSANPKGATRDILLAEELQEAFEALKLLRPCLEEEADFEMENVTETLRWLQFLWCDFKSQAHGVAMAITALVAFRCFCNGVAFCNTSYVNNLLYDKEKGGPEPMVQRLRRQKIPLAQVQRKFSECQAALLFLQPVIAETLARSSKRIWISFHAAYAVLDDSLNYLTCYLKRVEKEACDGKLVCEASAAA